MTNELQKVLTETVATFFLVFLGCGAIVVNSTTSGALGLLGVCLTFGMAVAALVYAAGPLSGAHMNPAVTISQLTLGYISAPMAFAYIGAQMIGATVASLALLQTFGPAANLGATLPAGSVIQSFWIEFISTGFLMFVICSFSDQSSRQAPFAGLIIGMVIVLLGLFGGPISGASLNPARSFGPAFISGHLEHLWVYLVAPTLGAICGGFARTQLDAKSSIRTFTNGTPNISPVELS